MLNELGWGEVPGPLAAVSVMAAFGMNHNPDMEGPSERPGTGTRHP